MESSYGIGITNRYSCFLDNEDDPVEALKATEVDKEAKKKGKIAEKENRGKDSGDATSNQKTGSVAVTNPAAARKGIRDSNKTGNDANKQNNKITNNGVVGRPARGPRPAGPGQDPKNVMFNDEDREDRNNRRNLNRDDPAREGRQDGEFNRGGPRRPGGQFRPRGPPGGRPRGPGGPGGAPGAPSGVVRKREFDRQSGSDKSGVKPVDKREGAGSRNWGTYKDDIDDVTATATPDETMDEKNDSQEITETGDVGKEETTEQNENVEPDQEAGPKLMTLDEWKALQQPRQKPVFNLRKAGEGEDQTQWKKMILKKKEKEEQSGDEEEYEEDYDCPQRAGRQKQILEIDFHFTDSRRGGPGGRGGRGGRGGERGGGGGGGERGGANVGGERGGERGGDRDRDRERGGERGVGAGGTAGPPSGTGAVGRGERGDRGGPRPPRSAGTGGGSQSAVGGGYRSNRTNRFGSRYEAPRLQTAPKVDDVNDFPSLG